MSFWQQLNQILSETPGNIVYHLVTLFAIQATLAIALSQWRRERAAGREDRVARRLAWAAFGLFLVRFAFLVASLVAGASGDRLLPVQILPPLEQAANTATVILVVWAVVPSVATLPRLYDVVALLLLLLTGVMYTFFVQEWATVAAPGAVYNGSEEATLGGIFQLVVLTVGALLLLLKRRLPDRGVRFSPVFVLFLAHFMQQWDFPESVPTNTEIPFWVRLGHLVAFPLLAVFSYRHALQRLLSARLAARPATEQLVESLRMATRVIDSPTLNNTVNEAVTMIAEVLDASFVGVALLAPDDPEYLELTSTRTGSDELQRWGLRLGDWPSFRLAMDQGQTVELLPDGLGARQLHDLAREVDVPETGALLVEPLLADENRLGVLLLGGPSELEQWPAETRSLAPPLAGYVAHALANARAYEGALQEVSPLTPASEAMISGRVIALEEERDRAQEEVEILSGRLQHSDARLAEAQQQVRDLAATVQELEQEQGTPAKIRELEAEIGALRASLAEAEEAMARAAAGEAELSTEWVMLAVSRYSGELEDAQARISSLEAQLEQREAHEVHEVVAALAQTLRTPLTSIAGYTEILLSETVGILGSKQLDFLERMKNNVERMGVLLDEIVQLSSESRPSATVTDVEMVDVHDVIDTAVSTVITQVRRKKLRLNLSIDQEIPPFPANRDVLCQVLIHLLSNASQASTSEGEMTLSAHTDDIRHLAAEDLDGTEGRFIHFAVQDSGGGIEPVERAHVFDSQYRAEHSIAGLGDTGVGLAVAKMLINAHGGRIWVDSEPGVGSTFSVLLPLSKNGRPLGNNG